MSTAPLTIVIPALDAAETLKDTLDSLEEGRAAGLLDEILVVDGGSRDGTASIACGAGARVLKAERGRGPQLAAGGAAAKGPWLLFLHADSRPAPGWAQAVRDFIEAPGAEARAGWFGLRLDDPSPGARRIERLANWRARRLGLPYGDQGLLISRPLYDQLGGYQPLLLMEDVALVRRIGRARLRPLPATIVTSARRYRRDGWWWRPTRNVLLIVGYFLGVPPRLLARCYR